MIPSAKAKELVYRFAYLIKEKEDKEGFFANIDIAKQCALISVDEIYQLDLNIGDFTGYAEKGMFFSYWEEVKQEIEKL